MHPSPYNFAPLPPRSHSCMELVLWRPPEDPFCRKRKGSLHKQRKQQTASQHPLTPCSSPTPHSPSSPPADTHSPLYSFPVAHSSGEEDMEMWECLIAWKAIFKWQIGQKSLRTLNHFNLVTVAGHVGFTWILCSSVGFFPKYCLRYSQFSVPVNWM